MCERAARSFTLPCDLKERKEDHLFSCHLNERVIEKERHHRERTREDLLTSLLILLTLLLEEDQRTDRGTVAGELGAFGKVQQHESVCPDLKLVYEENGQGSLPCQHLGSFNKLTEDMAQVRTIGRGDLYKYTHLHTLSLSHTNRKHVELYRPLKV